MLSAATKSVLFLSSYSPLFAILGLRVALSWASYILWGVAAISILLSVVFYIWAGRKIAPHSLQVQGINPRGEAIAYVVTYVIPFVALNQESWQDWTALGVLLAVIAILYVNSAMIHVNPMLALFGWRNYELTTTAGPKILMTRTRHQHGIQTVKVVALGDNVVLEVQ